MLICLYLFFLLSTYHCLYSVSVCVLDDVSAVLPSSDHSQRTLWCGRAEYRELVGRIAVGFPYVPGLLLSLFLSSPHMLCFQDLKFKPYFSFMFLGAFIIHKFQGNDTCKFQFFN